MVSCYQVTQYRRYQTWSPSAHQAEGDEHVGDPGLFGGGADGVGVDEEAVGGALDRDGEAGDGEHVGVVGGVADRDHLVEADAEVLAEAAERAALRRQR